MDYFKTHMGNIRQKLREDENSETNGISPRLKVPEITLPGDGEELNLHGDVPGSTYSRNPGEISWQEIDAEEKAKAERSAGRSGRASGTAPDAPPTPESEAERKAREEAERRAKKDEDDKDDEASARRPSPSSNTPTRGSSTR